MFNVDKMFEFSVRAIQDFAKLHKEEQFYAFSINASGLCFNSEEEFKKTLQIYSKNYPDKYVNDNQILDLKYNIEAWEYSYFDDLRDSEGFDPQLYQDLYDIAFDNRDLNEQQLADLYNNTAYHQAMKLLVKRLNDANAFELLNKTQDFKAFLDDH